MTKSTSFFLNSRRDVITYALSVGFFNGWEAFSDAKSRLTISFRKIDSCVGYSN